ncbi:aldehyde dehydrogenase 22A1-like isoform X3 [Olea europaea var. sylvestris]|uniref:aldehyde dehydrogenase 22A1-like isoform X3 n=1 Tax=Olea europaea var. sylvestris TaxID=158386 RepID=UPI000C1CCCC5|nr:aldehyde dehydrogenase 22A1-like isoform X3 [Olea europaea var. sylvestris]
MNFASIQFFFSRFLQRDAQQKLNDSFREPPRQTDKVQCYETTTMKYLGYFPALKPGYCRRFIDDFSKSARPLYRLCYHI